MTLIVFHTCPWIRFSHPLTNKFNCLASTRNWMMSQSLLMLLLWRLIMKQKQLPIIKVLTSCWHLVQLVVKEDLNLNWIRIKRGANWVLQILWLSKKYLIKMCFSGIIIQSLLKTYPSTILHLQPFWINLKGRLKEVPQKMRSKLH